MLIRRYSPLFVDHKFISEIIGKFDEEVGKVHILEKSFLCMLVISVAWITNQWFVLVVWALVNTCLGLWRVLIMWAHLACLLSEMISALCVSAYIHVPLYILKIILAKALINLFHVSFSACSSSPAPYAKNVIKLLLRIELLESTKYGASLRDIRLLCELLNLALEWPAHLPFDLASLFFLVTTTMS